MNKKELHLKLGQRLRRQRRMLDFTQGYLAKEMKVAVSTVSFWENGNRCPNIIQLDKLEKLVGQLWPVE